MGGFSHDANRAAGVVMLWEIEVRFPRLEGAQVARL